MELSKVFPDKSPEVLEITRNLRALVLHIFPSAEETIDEDDMGFGFGKGYKDLVFVLYPYQKRINLGIVDGASLDYPWGLMAGSGKVHRHVKVTSLEQLQDPRLLNLMNAALRFAKADQKTFRIR